MRYIAFIPVTAALATTATLAAAESFEVSRSVTVDAPVEEIWNAIGDFCDLDDWHPAFTRCAVKAEDGSVHRILTQQDGGEFIEKLIAFEYGLSYTYRIISGPLPVERYTGTLSITPGDPSQVTWSSRFTSDDPEMGEAVAAFYDAGLASLKSRLEE